MRRLPLSSQTFSDIVETGYYVDKTVFIDKLVNIGKCFFLSRPRRFGKSTFISTLEAAFSGKKELFSGLYLENNWDFSKKHPVIKISFGGGVTRSKDELSVVIEDMFIAFEAYYSMQFDSQTIQGKLKELIISLYKTHSQKVVILIDEYDKPILDVIERDDDTPAEVRDELKNLYSVIKDMDAYTEFVFVTGVSKFSKVNLFSGLNNLVDITLDVRFSSICGYTKQELITIFKDKLENLPLTKIKEWYDGYHFLGETVYNPYNILLYLDKKEFQNYWFQTGTPSFLIKLIEKGDFHIPDIELIELSEDSLNSFDVDSIELEALLFQTGYLTIKKLETLGTMRIYHLKYPNIEVKQSLTDVILKYLSHLNTQKERNKSKLYRLLSENDLDGMKELFHSFFASIPYHWYTKNDISNYEGYYSSIFYCYFTALGIEVIPEDTTNHGRIDMTVVYKNRCYIFEFKVNELTETGRAINQLRKKKYYEKYKNYNSGYLDSGKMEEIYQIGVEFSKTDRNITNYEWEQVVMSS